MPLIRTVGIYLAIFHACFALGAEPNAVPQSEKRKVLIVDPSTSNRMLTEAQLDGYGWEIVEAGSEEEGMQKLEQSPNDFALVIAAVDSGRSRLIKRLPKYQSQSQVGMGFVSAVKRFGNIPVLIHSSEVPHEAQEESYRREAANAGASDILAMPASGDVMRQKVNELTCSIPLAIASSIKQ